MRDLTSEETQQFNLYVQAVAGGQVKFEERWLQRLADRIRTKMAEANLLQKRIQELQVELRVASRDADSLGGAIGVLLEDLYELNEWRTYDPPKGASNERRDDNRKDREATGVTE